MVENDVYETKKSFVNVICSLRFIKCPVVYNNSYLFKFKAFPQRH
ncbi:MAG: hypothetical protein RIR11_3215 [Bacteroidota bacterium]|jgi:hypothetical protein